MSQATVVLRCLALWLLAPEALFALATNRGPEKLPPLRPPAELLAPTWWEERGSQVILAGLALVAVVVLVVWWLRRPKPAVPVAPEASAKTALQALRGRAEDNTVVAGVAQNLRRYVQAVLGLPADEWTAEELLRAVGGRAPGYSEPAQALGALLRECEARAFAAVPPAAPPSLVERALAVVARFEALRALPAPAAPPVMTRDNPSAPPTLGQWPGPPSDGGAAKQGFS